MQSDTKLYYIMFLKCTCNLAPSRADIKRHICRKKKVISGVLQVLSGVKSERGGDASDSPDVHRVLLKQAASCVELVRNLA